MGSVMRPRQPFAALDGSRLQTLGSIKNRQNAVAIHQDTIVSPLGKSIETKSNKRAYSPTNFDDFDSENMDPTSMASPSKKARGFHGAPLKPMQSRFNLLTTPARTSTIDKPTLSLSAPATSNITPISHSRGSPKHKRVGLLSKNRRASSSPFRRVDPPSFKSSSAGALPFSIDAALSGTISSYKPTQKSGHVENEGMPQGWMFDIHEDTAEEEAANLMEHSASILDISSDDDCATKRQKTEAEVDKENVPPPDWSGPSVSRRAGAAPSPVHKGIHSKAKAAEKAQNAKSADAMLEDRVALAALEREDFFPDGLDGGSIQVIDEQKPSALSKETFQFVAPAVEAPRNETASSERKEEIIIRPDSPRRDTFA